MTSEGLERKPADLAAGFTPGELEAVKKRTRWKRWVGVAAVGLVGLLWLMGPTTHRLVLPNGRAYDVISLKRFTNITLQPRTGTTLREYGLKLTYYSGLRDVERLKREVALVATGVLPIADSQGMRLVWIQAARAIGPRFSTITISRTYRYDRDSMGTWHGPR